VGTPVRVLLIVLSAVVAATLFLGIYWLADRFFHGVLP
jgi:hypothetical protein